MDVCVQGKLQNYVSGRRCGRGRKMIKTLIYWQDVCAKKECP
jgi:hypothetical protein